MLGRTNSIAFNGLEVLNVDLQIQISSGLPAFTIVGLPDKAVAESKERVRSALENLGIEMPAKRITINLSPADLPKTGSHFDLPIALGLLGALEVLPQDCLNKFFAMGELSLDGKIISVNGVLPVALHAQKQNMGLICPAAQGSEAAWVGLKNIVAAPSLLGLLNHLKGIKELPFPQIKHIETEFKYLDLADVKGQETAKKALEIAAAGGHNMLMVGPPGSGKSMLASRLPSILPPLTPEEALETSAIQSVAGELKDGKICFERPFRAPHHNASTPALVGGGRKAEPGEISLAHNGVLFLDELPEFNHATLESLRQPLENGYVSISRVNAHTTYPAHFQLIAAMNPCRCGYLGNPAKECKRAPLCAEEYQNKISGPLLDRIDIHIDVPAVKPAELAHIKRGETSAEVAKRVLKARQTQKERFIALNRADLFTNSQLKGEILEQVCELDENAKQLLISFSEKFGLSARAYHRILRLARTIADLQNDTKLHNMHIAEALSYRRQMQK